MRRELRSRFLRIVGIFLFGLLVACSDDATLVVPEPPPPPPPPPQPELAPVVFVHGQSGSAQQFETQAMRFIDNGFPPELLFAFEYDTGVEGNPVAELDAFLDDVLAETGESAVYAIGHSRGTSVWTTYLDDPAYEGPARVAKYVNVDGRSPDALPGGVPTIGIWGEWNTADSGFNRRENNDSAQIGPEPEANYYFGDKAHTEVLTSAEVFGIMYEFLAEISPQTLDVVEENSGAVQIAGRAVLFPENLGFEGVPLEVWEIDSDTGQRVGEAPVETAVIPASGAFGPFALQAGSRYEFALLREATENVPVETVHHFYPEALFHDNVFLRLQSSVPGTGIEAFIPRWEDSAGLVITRQKELWGDQGADADELFINGLNVLTPVISPRGRTEEGGGTNLAYFAFDANGDNVTDLEAGELFPFNLLSFLTGADVFMPAEATAMGSTKVSLIHRGGVESTLDVPNWSSADHRVSLMFRDDL